MANRRKPAINLAEELAPIFQQDDPIEALLDLSRDPGAWQTPGALARIGAALTHIGATVTEAAKDAAQTLTLAEDDGVFFTFKGPSTQTRVNTKYMKERFPAVNYPDMWMEVTSKGSVNIDLPFQKGGNDGN